MSDAAQRVAARFVGEQRPQLGQVYPEGGTGAARRLPVPCRVDQLVGGHHLAEPARQQGQQPRRPSADDRNATTLALYEQRAEQQYRGGHWSRVSAHVPSRRSTVRLTAAIGAVLRCMRGELG